VTGLLPAVPPRAFALGAVVVGSCSQFGLARFSLVCWIRVCRADSESQGLVSELVAGAGQTERQA
jgi:hypothetical protein